MFNRTAISKGMTVKSLDGEKLGKVISYGDTSFEIEKGLFFVKDYRVRYEDVRGIESGEITLAIGKEALAQDKESFRERVAYGRDRPAPATTAAGVTAAGTATRPIERIKEKLKERREGEGWNEEIRIPLHHEELSFTKSDKGAGEVHIHKSVVEEERTITVPLRRETVRVEHRPFRKDQPIATMAFKEEDVVMPLHAEGAEVTKRQYADEEVVIHKDAIEEQRSYSGKVMREKVDIDGGEPERR